ncbi:MAG: hypothetical protein ACRYHA_14130 [Janthinobacterium lividum]
MHSLLVSMRAGDGTPRRRGRTAAALLVATAALAACALPSGAPPDGAILSRLPAGTPGAAATQAAVPPPDASEQARRYDQIDRQALQDSENAIRADAAARAASAMAAQSSLYYGVGYGGYGWGGPAYYGYGWGPGWYGRGRWGGPRSGVFIGQSWGW